MHMTNFCNHLFDESTDGYIPILKLENKDKNEKTIKIYNTKNKDLINTIKKFQNKSDVFLAPNTMYLPKRRVENIRQFRALFQDMDLIKLGFEKAETIYIIWDLYHLGKIPKPTMITDSGQGLHLYWKIKNAPYSALNTWQELQDYLYHQLKHLCADKKATDGARVLRLPGTINSKNKSKCEILYIDNDTEYSMYDLREKYLNYKPKSYKLNTKKTKYINNKVISNSFFNSYSLHNTRCEDLLIICELRNYDIKGYRNLILHCFSYWKGIYIRDLEKLESVVMNLNNTFVEPLKDTEVKAILRSIDKSVDKFIAYEQGIRSGESKRVSKGMRDKEGYWYKNETLIDKLGITRFEETKLKTIISTKEKYRRNNEKRRKNRRNEEGLTIRTMRKIENENKVKQTYLQGYKQTEIANQLGLSKSWVSKLIKEIK